MQRALIGFAVALVIGVVDRRARRRGSKSCAHRGRLADHRPADDAVDRWFPLAILLFKLTEGAILFVVVLGAAPSIANGLIAGVDHIPPMLLRAGPSARRARLHPVPPRDPAGRRCRRSSAG